MKLTLGAFASGLSTSALHLVDRPFDHRPIGKEGFNEPFDFVAEMKQALPKPTESLSL